MFVTFNNKYCNQKTFYFGWKFVFSPLNGLTCSKETYNYLIIKNINNKNYLQLNAKMNEWIV